MLSLNFNSPSLFFRPLEIVPRKANYKSSHRHLHFPQFFHLSEKISGIYLSFRFSFIFILWSAGTAKSPNDNLL